MLNPFISEETAEEFLSALNELLVLAEDDHSNEVPVESIERDRDYPQGVYFRVETPEGKTFYLQLLEHVR